MDTKTPSDQLITQYLLGSLSAEETERLDELSLADDEFAVRLQVVENELIDAYVGGELSGQMLQQFSSFYLSSPKRCEKVRFAHVFHSAAERLTLMAPAERGQPGVTAPPVEQGPGSRRTSPLRWPSGPGLAWQWGWATAALLLLVAGCWLALQNWRLGGQMDQAQTQRKAGQQSEQELLAQLAQQRSLILAKETELARLRESLDRIQESSTDSHSQAPSEVPAIVAFALAPQSRGISQMAAVTVPADTDYVAIELQLESGDYTIYRATLKTVPENQVIWRSERLKARNNGDLKVLGISLRPGVLKSSKYMVDVFSISPEGGSEIVGSYAFRVIKQ